MKPKWKCDISGRTLEYKLMDFKSPDFPGFGPNEIEGHEEQFCFKCWGNGIMWAMKQANKKEEKK